jgi:DNA-binding Lrp family transcriptional regulator
MKMPKVFVLIHTETGKENDVLKDLKKLEVVKEAYAVYGSYDIIAKVVAEDMDVLNAIISGRIRRMDGINSTGTLFVIED